MNLTDLGNALETITQIVIVGIAFMAGRTLRKQDRRIARLEAKQSGRD